MTWDIPQFKALVDGLSSGKDRDAGADLFLILADAFDECEDERGKFLRRFISRINRDLHRYENKDRWFPVQKYVDTITHIHPFEYSLRNTFAYWRIWQYSPSLWKTPGCEWNYEQSVLSVACKNVWHYHKVCITIRKLNRSGVKCSLIKDHVGFFRVLFPKPHLILNQSHVEVLEMN